MKISALIQILERIKETSGDLDVVIMEDGDQVELKDLPGASWVARRQSGNGKVVEL